jgi:cytochrome b561
MYKNPSQAAITDDERRAVIDTMHSINTPPERYHPALVALHWLSALLLTLALGMGTFVLAETPNDAMDKIDALRGHMIMGIAIGSLMLVRLIVRLRTNRPSAASTGHAALDRLRSLAHGGLYLMVFVMAASGGATALLSGLPEIAFGNTMMPLPESFFAYPPRFVHGWVAKALFLLIGFHVIGALFHQFGFKDRLLSRMWFGKKAGPRS